MGHKFGGYWTSQKLHVLESYLNAYTTALSDQNFELIYLDAFAGTGERTVVRDGNALFGEESDEVQIDGSAKIALQTKHSFNRLIFIEERTDRVLALQKLAEQNPSRFIDVIQGDANVEVQKFCKETAWRPKEGAPRHGRRAVIFLDPLGLNVAWETLRSIANTEAIDLWFLFSISGLYRQAATNKEAVDEHKAACIDRALGTKEWRKHLYSKENQSDLFNDEAHEVRNKNVKELEQYVKDRLETIFKYVASPLPLPKGGGPQKFSLFFCVANPDGPAIGLSTRIAKNTLLQV